jgi:hypothetical protein
MSITGCARMGWRVAALVTGALLLGACENNLIFMERTGFNLAIRVNNDPTTPVEVNAGLKRSVVALVPPTGDPVKTATGTRANGEAVNLVSGYDLGYTESSTSLFAGTLAIRTQFASGAAAEAVSSSGDPKAVMQVVNTREATFSYDDAAKKLRSFWKPDGNVNQENQKKLTDWMKQNGLSTEPGSITLFLYDNSSLFQEARAKAVKDLKLQ